MTDLILSMMTALDEHNGNMKFSQQDIDNLIKKYNILNDKDLGTTCNELGWIILWERKYITDEKFATLMDIEIRNGEFWIVCGGFDDILSKSYETEISVLGNNEDWWERSDFYDNYNIDEYSHRYDEETLKCIKEYCIKHSEQLYEEDEDYEDVTGENLILKDGKLYFKNTSFFDLIDQLDELNTQLCIAISEAEEDAEKSQIYKIIKNNFEDKVGEFEFKNVKTKNYKGEEKNVGKLYVHIYEKMNIIKKHLIECYGEYDFNTEDFGSLASILKDMEYFNFKQRDYDRIYADFDNETLNEFTQSRLDF